MLIREFNEAPNLEDVDLIDDLQFFMENDPTFYRKMLYPIISKLRDIIKSGKISSDRDFRPCVDRAVDIYCKKFKISGNPKSVFTDVDRDAVARKIFNQECDRIQRGVYDKEES